MRGKNPNEGSEEKKWGHTEREKGICEWVAGLACRGGCGTTIFIVDVGSERGGSGRVPKAVDGVLGEMDPSDPEGELVRSVVASSSSSESLHLEGLSSSSSSSSSSCS